MEPEAEDGGAGEAGVAGDIIARMDAAAEALLNAIDTAGPEATPAAACEARPMKVKSIRVLARLSASVTPGNAAGCQEMAMSTSEKQPSRTMNALAAPPSSAGQP